MYAIAIVAKLPDNSKFTKTPLAIIPVHSKGKNQLSISTFINLNSKFKELLGGEAQIFLASPKSLFSDFLLFQK